MLSEFVRNVNATFVQMRKMNLWWIQFYNDHKSQEKIYELHLLRQADVKEGKTDNSKIGKNCFNVAESHYMEQWLALWFQRVTDPIPLLLIILENTFLNEISSINWISLMLSRSELW